MESTEEHDGLSRGSKAAFLAAGIVVLALAAGSWFLPLALSNGLVTKQTIETTKGDQKSKEESFGWGAAHSDQIAITLSGIGVVLLLVGTGVVQRLRLPFADVDLRRHQKIVRTVAEEVVAKAPENPGDAFDKALAQLEADASVARQGRLNPTARDIETAVDQVIARESQADG